MTSIPAPSTVQPKIRICKVAGRFFLFDLADVMRLRRTHSMCSILVGTNPQAPNQNLFSGLPLELLEEEARLLVDRDDACIVDDVRAHLQSLTAMPEHKRRAYVAAQSSLRDEARQSLEAEMAARARAVKEAMNSGAMGGKAKKGKRKGVSKEGQDGKGDILSGSSPAQAEQTPSTIEEVDDVALFDKPSTAAANSAPSVPTRQDNPSVGQSSVVARPYLTPGTSKDLVPSGCEAVVDPIAADEEHTVGQASLPPQPTACPLYNRLNSQGYFMTPGIRFGGQYSVYPGDPFRFHAHFIANSYEWDQGIDMLELVGVGRLAGAVKKGLLLGAEKPGEGAGEPDGRNVRTFCIEWAGM